jgi:hypothetical protein
MPVSCGPHECGKICRDMGDFFPPDMMKKCPFDAGYLHFLQRAGGRKNTA